MGKRKSISKRSRFEVFKRDRFKCQYCGQSTPQVVLEIDHVIPVSKGGTNDAVNLVTSCYDCNRGKSDVSLDQAIPAIAERIAIEQERLEQVKAFNRFAKQAKNEENKAVKQLCESWYSGVSWNNPEMPDEQVRSLRLFLRRLPLDGVLEAMDIALSKKPMNRWHDEEDSWKYFCGVCWKTIKGGNK